MLSVQVCRGLCASPDVVKNAAHELMELVIKRNQQWELMDYCGIDDRVEVEKSHLSDVMGKLIQIGAIVRAWIDADRAAHNNPEDRVISGNITNANVGKRLNIDRSVDDLEFRDACNGLIHADTWWLDVDNNGCCKGSSIRIKVPANQRTGKPLRIETICLVKFATTTLKMLDVCPTCTGETTSEDWINGLPRWVADDFPLQCTDGDVVSVTVGA